MGADDPLGVDGVLGDLPDHDGGGAGADDGVGTALGLNVGQGLLLDLQVLRDVLQDEVGVGHGLMKVGGVRGDGGAGGVLLGGEHAVVLKPLQALLDALLGALQGLLGHVVHGDVLHAVIQKLDGPAGADEAGAHQGNFLLRQIFHR